MHKIT